MLLQQVMYSLGCITSGWFYHIRCIASLVHILLLFLKYGLYLVVIHSRTVRFWDGVCWTVGLHRI